jgi:glycosyltransferase involved in cell wall biosynthesis
MPAVMNALDCLVHPAIGVEALGLVICEAHACGRPVIATALDGIPEAFAVGGHGRLITPESIDEMAAAMVEQMESPPLDAAERERLHRRVDENFSVPAAAKRMLEIYHSLLPHPTTKKDSPG